MTETDISLSPGAHPPRATIRTALIALALVVAIFGAIFLWRAWRNAAPPPGAPPPTRVVATVVTPADTPASLDAVGSLRAVREVMLAPETAGRVTAINFTAGQSIANGAVLVQLYDAPERADRRQAAARAALAAAQFARSAKLAPLGADSAELLEQRRAERDQAAAAVQQLDARIAQKQIRAPFAGSLGLRKINLGQYLNPGDAIATLTALDTLYVDFTVPQQDLPALRVGNDVQVVSDAWPGRTFTARVNAIEPRIGEDTRNVSVQAVLANSDRRLRPGMYVTASLDLPAERGVLTLPATAIITTPSGDSVLVVRGANPRTAGKAAPVLVTTGRRFGDRIVVTSGLKPGDVVVTEGQLRVQPGAAVRIVPAAAKGAR
ncbi:efflux RND transporter periplasmic adaptor subunit [Sphingomonas sp. MMSM20]|uniref:efflux RND transporter periplasmic adaptor subunit n=1 Tax=Sphingomonas lycopersici TaxID=2951807 RepID=UPI00223913A5|nr:efflux RND transporter periplasmic adaptor subunit [Sphingomonas lycopersici]MCW6528989.1 efflux RND transporter periplasmic adaptor subunit [Sphingomonas lycopersici]